jgi:hypothetical protein
MSNSNNSSNDDERLLGGEPCLLDRTVEINGVQTLLAALTKEEKTAALVDPSMTIRHFRAAKVGLLAVVVGGVQRCRGDTSATTTCARVHTYRQTDIHEHTV